MWICGAPRAKASTLSVNFFLASRFDQQNWPGERLRHSLAVAKAEPLGMIRHAVLGSQQEIEAVGWAMQEHIRFFNSASKPHSASCRYCFSRECGCRPASPWRCSALS